MLYLLAAWRKQEQERQERKEQEEGTGEEEQGRWKYALLFPFFADTAIGHKGPAIISAV